MAAAAPAFEVVRAEAAAAWLAAARRCARCGGGYTEAEALGGWPCRRHADRLVSPADAATPAYASVHVGVYACCGRSPFVTAPAAIYENPNTAGCVPCDHVAAFGGGVQNQQRAPFTHTIVELPAAAAGAALLERVRRGRGFVFFADVRGRVARIERRVRERKREAAERDRLVVAAAEAVRAAHAEHRRSDDAAYERDGNQYHRELVDPVGAFAPFVVVARSALPLAAASRK